MNNDYSHSSLYFWFCFECDQCVRIRMKNTLCLPIRPPCVIRHTKSIGKMVFVHGLQRTGKWSQKNVIYWNETIKTEKHTQTPTPKFIMVLVLDGPQIHQPHRLYIYIALMNENENSAPFQLLRSCVCVWSLIDVRKLNLINYVRDGEHTRSHSRIASFRLRAINIIKIIRW